MLTPLKTKTPDTVRRTLLNIDDMLQKVGNSNKYQKNLIIIFLLQFLVSAFIQMGFPIIFRPALLLCADGSVCPETPDCSSADYTASDAVKSVAYTFDLYCQRKKYLEICFSAFLYGGFFGCLYYGEVQERKGRKYVVHQSMFVTICGIVLSILSGRLTVFSIGVFLINFGFRGFYNAAILSLVEVSSQMNRATQPIFLHLGWAAGQILIAIMGTFITDWRTIFLITTIGLSILLFFSFKNLKQSPRLMVVKRQFGEALSILQEIAVVNERSIGDSQLEEQYNFNKYIQNYSQMHDGEQVITNTRHHSYFSLFRYESIRIRVFILSYIWSIISISYFMSANSKLHDGKSFSFNLVLAGAIEIVAYLWAARISLNMERVDFIRNLLIYSAIFHLLFYFVRPIHEYQAFGRLLILTLQVLIRLSMSVGNVIFVVYSLELFPTTIRHFAIGFLGFVTKLMYMLSVKFSFFWVNRDIHPNLIVGMLLLSGLFTLGKLSQTKSTGFKDYLKQDDNGNLMTDIQTSHF